MGIKCLEVSTSNPLNENKGKSYIKIGSDNIKHCCEYLLHVMDCKNVYNARTKPTQWLAFIYACF